LHSPTLSTTDLRWKIDALPDPTQPTGSLISGRAEVRHKTDLTVVPVMAGRRVTNKSAAAPIVGDRTIAVQIIAAAARGFAQMIPDGAMDAPMGDLQEKTE